MDTWLKTGYPYELVGLFYFLFYLAMSRGRAKDRYSRRSKIFTLLASMALIGSVPFQYGTQPLAVALMFGVAAVALWSTYLDRRAPPPA